MTPFRRAVPSINALVTFEAAARLKSFTVAARELGVTQAAVSRQIRMLEENFGTTLFRRGHRRVEPTAAGSVLGATLTQCFGTISDAVGLIRQPRGPDILTVGATIAFSHFWLLPRLSSFRDAYPDINIRIVSQDEPFDPDADDLDVLIRYGTPASANGQIVAAKSDVVFPVCSPGFASRLKPGLTAADLLTQPLITSDTPESSWIGWTEWFGMVGLARRKPRAVLQFNHYTDSISAALAGQGIALGWHLIVQRLVADGLLVRLTESTVAPDGVYNALAAANRQGNPAVQAFLSWITVALED